MLTLPARYYRDHEYFREELGSFYFGMWICAGRADAIPSQGDYFLCEFGGESAIVTRGAGGEIRAFYNVCRHRGTRLCMESAGRFDSRIQCPYHGWTYGLDGRLLGAPHMDDAGFRRDEFGLREVRVSLWDGHVFLHFGAGAGTLEQQLGALPAKFAPWRMEDLRLHQRTVYDVHANWKLIILNFNECLHCPLVHPALNRLTDYLGADNEAPSEHYVGGSMGFRDGAETMSVDGRRSRDYLPCLSEAEHKLVQYYAIYPNLLLSLHPDYMMLHRLWPQAVDRTTIVCEWHFHPAEMAKTGFTAADAIEFWDQTNREDWAVIERSQLGMQSRGYLSGPYSSREALLHGFDEVVLEHERRRRDQHGRE